MTLINHIENLSNQHLDLERQIRQAYSMHDRQEMIQHLKVKRLRVKEQIKELRMKSEAF